MTGNDFEVVGKYSENYLDEVLVHDGVYAKFLAKNKGVNEDFYERGWVKLLSVLVDGFGFYRITNEQNVIVTANAEEYADYNGNVASDNRAGYKIGGVSAKWTLYRVRFDRAVQFKLDEVDLNLAGLTRMVGPILDEFYRTRAVPEIDATYSSIIADATSTSLGNKKLEALTSANVISALLAGEGWLFQHGVNNADAVLVMRWSVYQALATSSDITRYLSVGEYKPRADLSLRINYFNGHPIFLIPDDRAFTDVALTQNGYTTSALSRYINFAFVNPDFLYPIIRINRMRTYDNSVITSFDGYIFNNHLWHDLIIPMNKRVGLYVSCDTSLIGANDNKAFVSSVAGQTEGYTIIDSVFTEPKALNYNKIYYKATAFEQGIGETQVGGTLVELGSQFAPTEGAGFFALTDGAGVIIALSDEVELVVAE